MFITNATDLYAEVAKTQSFCLLKFFTISNDDRKVWCAWRYKAHHQGSSKLRWRHNNPIFLHDWVSLYWGAGVWLHAHQWACIHRTNTGNDISSAVCDHTNINSCFKIQSSYHLENIIVSWLLILKTERYKGKNYFSLALLLFPEHPPLASMKRTMLGQILCRYSSWGSKFLIKHLWYFDNSSCICCSGRVWDVWSHPYSYHSGLFKILSFIHRSDYQTYSTIKIVW